MLSDSLYDFISERKHLIWYVKDYRALNEEAVVEATLNYGDGAAAGQLLSRCYKLFYSLF